MGALPEFPMGPSGTNWVEGGVSLTTRAAGVAGREGLSIWSDGGCSARRRMLQSEPALHPNQRCGGCAASRQSSTQRAARRVLSQPLAPAHPCHCPAVPIGGEGGDGHTDRGPKAQEIQAKTPRVGTKKAEPVRAPWRVKETETKLRDSLRGERRERREKRGAWAGGGGGGARGGVEWKTEETQRDTQRIVGADTDSGT